MRKASDWIPVIPTQQVSGFGQFDASAAAKAVEAAKEQRVRIAVRPQKLVSASELTMDTGEPEEEGLPQWAMYAAIGGGVLVVATVAYLAFKPKKPTMY
ncbi:MAG: hypothetical protein ACYTEQ_05150 [Planctomycetota bacterium]